MKRILTQSALTLLLASLLGACAQKSYVTLIESPDGSTGKVIITGAKGQQQVIDKANFSAPVDGSAPAELVDPEKLAEDFAQARSASPQLPERFLLYFETGGSQLTPESLALLPSIIETASKRATFDMSIIGHSDTVGDAAANEALSLVRAQAIAELIKEKALKVDALSIESHGERNLLVPTPDETSEPRNRRVEISIR
jgi:peptidoglycan-associated lipoprotein